MAKFKYYITDVMNGEVVGTDDKDTAQEYAESDDYFVVDAESGRWLMSGGEDQDIEAASNDEVTEEEDEDE